MNDLPSLAAEAVIVTDRRHCVTALNRAAEALTGWCAEAASGTPLYTLLGTEPGAAVLPAGWCMARARDGAAYRAHALTTPICDASGGTLGAVTVLSGAAPRNEVREPNDGFDLASPEIALAIDALGTGIRERAEEVAALMDVLPVALYIAHDRDCVAVTSNRAAAALLAPPRSAAGAVAGPYAHRVFRGGLELNPREMPIQRAAAEGIATTGEEYEIRYADGSSKFIYGYAVPLFGTDGTTRGAVSAFIDVTERRAQESALRESEERFRVLADNLPVMIWVSDRSGRCTYANRTLREFTGLHDADSWRDHIHPEDKAAVEREFAAQLARRAPYRGELRVRRPDGECAWVMNNGTPVYGPDGEFSGYIGTCTDITSTKRHEEHLERADRQKDEFIATLAHELRNPLAPIRNALHILGSGALDASGMRWARDVIDRQVNQLVRLVDDLLDVARAACGQLELRRETFTLDAIVHDAIEASRPLLEHSRHELSIALPAQPVAVNGDRTRLAEILINLLNNAAKYTPTGGRVTVICDSTETQAIVRVRDTGVGIAADALPGIFRMFSQVDSSLHRSQGGLGVGLALARRLAELHGGTLTAYSAGLGEGSEFVVTLPRVPLPVPVAAEHPDRAADRPHGHLRVLVVDDSEDAADSLALLLRLDGHEVATANDGLEALDRYGELHPEAVILDIGLPGIDGYEVAERIRQRPDGHETVLIALTGWGRHEERERAFGAGFDHHITKPVSVEALQRLLRAQHTT